MTETDAAREALRLIAEGGYPRQPGTPWRADGQRSKLDQCVHRIFMSDDCGNCISEYALSVLASTPETGRGG